MCIIYSKWVKTIQINEWKGSNPLTPKAKTIKHRSNSKDNPISLENPKNKKIINKINQVKTTKFKFTTNCA